MTKIKDLSDPAWQERQGERIGEMSVAGFAARVIGGLIALTVVLGLIGYLGGWFNEGKRIVSVQNVKDQWGFAYQYDESLKAIASQYCAAKDAQDAETDPSLKSQRVTQTLAIQQNYARVQAQYDARLRNAFEARLVAPPDVPRRAPSLPEETAQVCG